MVDALGNATDVVWLPSFPAEYYRVSRGLYWPLQWYFTLLAPLRAHPQEGVPLQRHLLRSSHRRIRPAAPAVEGVGCVHQKAVTNPQSRTPGTGVMMWIDMVSNAEATGPLADVSAGIRQRRTWDRTTEHEG